MTWKAVGPVVQKVVSRIVDIGEGSVAAEPRRPKRAASTTPAAKSFRETNVTEGETTLQNPENWTPPTIGRDRRTGEHPQLGHAPAPLVRRSMLTVIEGGRTTEGRKLYRPTFRSSPRSKASELGWVVHAAT